MTRCCMAILGLALAACSGAADGGDGRGGARVTGPIISGAGGAASMASNMNSPGGKAPEGSMMAPVLGSGGTASQGAAPGSGVIGSGGAPAAGPAAMGGGAAGVPPMMVTPTQTLPPATGYDAPGPYDPAIEVDNTGPGGAYTLYRPTNLDAGGFKFIPATWGNGITTTPQYYPWLTTVASHGFVIIASNDMAVTPQEMTDGLDWLLAQNDAAGELQGKLDTSRAVCIGYSLGGAGSVTCGSHEKVIATVAMHPAGGLAAGLHGPLLLFSGTNDTVCIPASFVQPIFDSSAVPTFYGMIDGADHLEPVLPGVVGGGRETAPLIAWLRLWVFGDEDAKPFFYGTDCGLCKAPWIDPQSKMLQ